VSCFYAGTELTGTYITERNGSAVLKLDNGYNIGVGETALTSVEAVSAAAVAPVSIEVDPSLPEFSIISTGGTIASRIDYRTGAVTSQFNADDILRAIPGLSDIGRFRSHVLANILSENMTPAMWSELAGKIYEEITAAVSFMLKTPVPVVFVGSQRSADRPSSDNVMNGLCSAAAAGSDLGEVAVVMHGTTNDDYCAIHRGTRVRKMHTSRRDAFRSIGVPPIGRVDYPSLEMTLTPDAVKRGSCEAELNNILEERVGLLTFYPGMLPDMISAYSGYAGLVLSGTGLGHVSGGCVGELKSLIDDGTEIVMTSQCLNGRVCDRVYDTGRDLLHIGVIEGEDMLPEVALVKLMWVLGQERDPEAVKSLMQTDLCGEMGRCTKHGL